MESAIPKHLLRERSQPKAMPAGFRSPLPAWVARFDPLVEQVVMAHFGAQSRDGLPSGLEHLAGRFAQKLGPKHWERARYVDARGYDTLVFIAYWDDPAAFNAWRAESGFDAWWRDPARQHEPCGYFLEVVTPTADRFETLFSSPDRPEGIACLQAGVSGEIEEHNYWGGARDRIPLSQVDPLAPGPKPLHASPTDTRGERVVVPGRANLCLIRSGQDWTDTRDQERSLYLEQVQPTLAEGMRFLRDEGAPIGCLSCRYMTVVDVEGKPLEKTFGLAHFDSLANLEQWAKSHPTHLAIFRTFLKYAQDLGFQIALRLYHEVTVVPENGQYFEYVNCHPATGLLGRA